MSKPDATRSRFGLDILFLLLLAALTLTALAAYADASIELVRQPEASATLAKIFGESGILSPFVHTEGYRYGTKLEEAHCSVWIQNRPDRGAPPTRSSENRIECTFKQAGQPGKIILSLASEFISAFGSQKDRGSKEKSISFNGGVGDPLYHALEAAQKANTEDQIFFLVPLVCTPAGNLCTESVGINQTRADSTKSAISCTREWTWLKDHYVESRYGCVIPE